MEGLPPHDHGCDSLFINNPYSNTLVGAVTLKLPGKRVQAGSAISVFQLAQVGPFANIPDVHPLADWRTDSRTVETDGNVSEIPKRGIILPSGGLKVWKNTRKVVRKSKESSL